MICALYMVVLLYGQMASTHVKGDCILFCGTDPAGCGIRIDVSVFILIASVIGVGVISAKIYRVGVLLSGIHPFSLSFL